MMKETVLEVLMYLFDNYFDDDYQMESDQDALRTELIRAGFVEGQVDKAFDWLEGLVVSRDLMKVEGTDRGASAMRVFSEFEMDKLNAQCRGYLMFLEQAGILDADNRELVIDRAIALDLEEIELGQLKWIILMVLLNQPGHEVDSGWMEDLVMDREQIGLH